MEHTSVSERRSRRSDKPHEALGYWLESLARHHGARGMAISTLDGLPIAVCGDVDGPLFAAQGTIEATGGSSSRAMDDLDTTVVSVDGGWHVVLTVTGARCPSSREVGPDIRRILA